MKQFESTITFIRGEKDILGFINRKKETKKVKKRSKSLESAEKEIRHEHSKAGLRIVKLTTKEVS